MGEIALDGVKGVLRGVDFFELGGVEGVLRDGEAFLRGVDFFEDVL